MPSISKIEYLVNKRSGIVHRRVGGGTPESCNVDQINTMQVALKLDRLYYKRLCARCFSAREGAVVARSGAGLE